MSKQTTHSRPHVLAPPCVFGAIVPGSRSAISPGLDGAPFCFATHVSDGPVFVALEDGRVFSMRAGVRLDVRAGWLAASLPGDAAVVDIAPVVSVRAAGHDEMAVCLAAQGVTDVRTLH